MGLINYFKNTKRALEGLDRRINEVGYVTRPEMEAAIGVRTTKFFLFFLSRSGDMELRYVRKDGTQSMSLDEAHKGIRNSDLYELRIFHTED